MFQYNSKSFFSRAPESLKIIAFAFFFAMAIVLNSVQAQLLLFAALLFLLVIAKFDSFKSFFGLVPFLLLADFSFWFFLQGTGINLVQLVVVSNIRVFNLVMATGFFAFSTDAFALAKFFKKLKMPETVSLPVFALFRFLPEIEKDFLEIRDIQKLRGITPKKPLHYLKSILVPLFITALQKSDELAIAYYLRKKNGREI